MTKIFWKESEIINVGKETVKILQEFKDKNEHISVSQAIILAQETVLLESRRRPCSSIKGMQEKHKQILISIGQRELYREKEEKRREQERQAQIAAEQERQRLEAEEAIRIKEAEELDRLKEPIRKIFEPVIEELAAIFKDHLAAKLYSAMKAELSSIQTQLPAEIKSAAVEAADPKKKKIKIIVVGWPEEFCKEFQREIADFAELKAVTNGRAGKLLTEAAKHAKYIVFNVAGSGHGASHSNFSNVRTHPGLIQIEAGSVGIKEKILELITR